MATIEENVQTWQRYDWKDSGSEWSEPWGSTADLWFHTLLPRIYRYLPTGTLLEIAPGHGRITEFLLPLCQSYVGVDVTPRCVEACQERFVGVEHASFQGGDGRSLGGVPDAAVDFAFSWDSLVHAEPEVLRSYAFELARTLRPGGHAFLHHSNFGQFLDLGSGEHVIENRHWRDGRMTAQQMRGFCGEAGLVCRSQELTQWIDDHLIDCISVVYRPREPHELAMQTKLAVHPDFGAECRSAARLRQLYS